MVQLWSGEGKVWRGVSGQTERREAWQGAGQAEKYKTGTVNLKKFRWNDPTGGNGSSTWICTVMCWKKYNFCELCLLLLDCFFTFGVLKIKDANVLI